MRIFLAALLAAVALPAFAQTADDQVAALRDAALSDTLAWQITEDLTTEVGQRLAGTQAEARAAGEIIEDDGEGFAKIVAYLENLKVI